MNCDVDDDRLCSYFTIRHAFQKLHLYSATKRNGCSRTFAATSFKTLTCLKIALYRFKWLVVSSKQSQLIATYSDRGAYNHYCNHVMRRFIKTLRCASFQKQRNCSTIYKWRYSLLHKYISLWLKQTQVHVQLKKIHLSRFSRHDSGSSFGEVVL